MINKYIIRGDCHTDFSWCWPFEGERNVAFIILGDAGVNFWLDKRDTKLKQKLQDSGFIFYLVRGNHEMRPERLPDIKHVYDAEVDQMILQESKYPAIRYLLDGKIYQFGKYRALVIGGAYSVDKFRRLYNLPVQTDNYNTIAKKAHWFPDEQLTQEEMRNISESVKGETVDFVFSHTCPYSWQPTDLFLPFVNQESVDNTMEKWMEELKDKFSWRIWCFGHYHADRIERPRVEQYFSNCEEIDYIYNRWTSGEELPWYLVKSPNYYMGV